MNQWLEDWVKPNRGHNTYRQYELSTRMYIVPLLGNIPLDDLTGQQNGTKRKRGSHMSIQQFLNKLPTLTAAQRFTEKHQKCNRRILGLERLSPATIQRVHSTLKSALSHAVKNGLLATNPAKNAESPKQQKYVAQPLTLKQGEKLLKAVEGNRNEALFTLAALGMRRGEILGVKWSDFIWSDNHCRGGVLNITRSVSRVGGKGVIQHDVKTQRSRRTIKLPKFVIDSILRRQLMQEQDRIDAGKKWTETGLVFTNALGGPLMPEKVNILHHRALKKAGLPDIRFHDLRHTAATLLLAAGVPLKMISEILGHSSYQFTADCYAHINDQMRDETTDAFDQMYGGTRQTVRVDESKTIQ